MTYPPTITAAERGKLNLYTDKEFWAALLGNSATGGGVKVPNFVAIGASASGNIPAGATSWSIVFLTGSGTIGGVAAPLNVPMNGGAIGTNVPYTTAASSTAFLMYETAA